MEILFLICTENGPFKPSQLSIVVCPLNHNHCPVLINCARDLALLWTSKNIPKKMKKAETSKDTHWYIRPIIWNNEWNLRPKKKKNCSLYGKAINQFLSFVYWRSGLFQLQVHMFTVLSLCMWFWNNNTILTTHL